MEKKMSRRELAKRLGLAGLATLPFAARWSLAAATAPEKPLSADAGHPDHDMSGYGIPQGPPQQIAMLVYPQMTVLDLIGPQQLLAGLGNVEVHLVWKDRSLVTSDSGVSLQPSATFETCPKSLTLLFVPGGAQGTVACMRDPEVLGFLADRGAGAGYVTSVCTGSLLLGAAGLLQGYRATSHWTARSLLSLVGATPVEARVVEDRNRITGAGVTAGLDFALRIASRLRNDKYAKALQLAFEYDPQPPFQAGTPAGAGPEITGMMDAMYAPLLAEMAEAARLARARRPAAGTLDGAGG